MKGLSLFLVLASVALGYAENRCPPEQADNWQIEQLLEHEDCHKFYKCTFGQPVEMTCYPGLYFNLETWQCDWMQNVDCGDRNDPALTTAAPEPTRPAPTFAPTTPEPETEAPTTPEPETEAPTTPEPETEAPTTPEPETEAPTTPEPETEAPTTPEPETEAPTTPEPETEAPTTPEPETEAPTTPEPVTEAPTTPEPEPETEKPDIEFQENGCPVNPHIHWLLPHENDCNLFYYCVWGQKVLRQCPSTLHFNRVLQVCDWPHDAGCATSFDKHITGRRLMSQVEVSLKL